MFSAVKVLCLAVGMSYFFIKSFAKSLLPSRDPANLLGAIILTPERSASNLK